MLTGLEIAGASIAGKKAFGHVVEELYKSGKDKTQKAFKRWRTTRDLSRLASRIAHVRQVKTLWQVDRSVDLSTFYCEQHISLDDSRIRISSLSDFKSTDSLLIEGIAGQGKSIFLRYLCAVELVRAEYFPVFLELRRIQQNQTLLQGIIMAFRELGVEIDEEIFQDIAATKKLVLFLDGFDEVHDDLKPKMTVEIENIIAFNENLRVIVSSRLESGLAMCPKLHVCGLSDLEEHEYKKVIYKLLDDTALAKQLIEQVEAHPGGLKQLLTTPLMVTLLVLGYKSYQELPAQLSDFYDSLFQVLLQRHDGVKPGYKRARACRMNDYQYRQVFEAFCFYIKQAKTRHLDDKAIHLAAEAAFKAVQINENAGKFIADILKITCLLVKDGAEYRFIHKSVQEFYAAAFITRKPDVIVKDIYGKLFLPKSGHIWGQETRFLSEIDPYRYNKYGFIPAICKFLDIKEETIDGLSKEVVLPVIKRYAEKCSSGFTEADGEHRQNYWCFGENTAFWLIEGIFVKYLFNFNCDSLIAEFNAGNTALMSKLKASPRDAGDFEIKYKDMMDNGYFSAEINEGCKIIAEEILALVVSAKKFVLQEERQEGILKLLE